jgi:hypothetical protein
VAHPNLESEPPPPRNPLSRRQRPIEPNTPNLLLFGLTPK